jgi:hypothetical protein
MSGSILDQYTPKEVSAPQETLITPANDSERYIAFTLGSRPRPERRLRLSFENGAVALMSYSYLMEVLCTSHQNLSLIYTNCVITLNGRNLFPLIDHLQEEKLSGVYCFSSEYFTHPAESEMVIYRIIRQTLQAALGGGTA